MDRIRNKLRVSDNKSSDYFLLHNSDKWAKLTPALAPPSKSTLLPSP